MWEIIVTAAIVAAAGYWLVRWFRGAASGECGCSSGCGGCAGDGARAGGCGCGEDDCRSK